MAKLHRGVLGLPHRAALIALALCFAPTEAWAQEEIGVDDIVGWAADLRSDDAAKRRTAYERLSHLPPSALPAIAERIERTRRQIVPAQDGREALRAFRHAVGSRRADDMVDIAPGILPVLEERRSREVGRTAERLLLLRSLEAIGTVEAQRRIADIFSLTNEMWRWEQRRVVHRMGVRLLPGLILARAHRDRGVRLWARGHIERLGMKDPANALRIEDPELLAQVIDAYAEVKDLDTMPLILSYVGHEDRRIREAARAAFESFGRNGIWQLREGIRKQLGRRPDTRWGWRRTMRELFEGLDERRMAPYAARLEEAQGALREGEAGRAKELLDALLRDAPSPPRPLEVAAAYAELASALEDPRLLRRACWLAPDAPSAGAWRARLALFEAEADRARGVLDTRAYRDALEHDPSERTRALASAVLGDAELSDPTIPEASKSDAYPSGWPTLLLVLLGTLLVPWAWKRGVSTMPLRTGAPWARLARKLRARARAGAGRMQRWGRGRTQPARNEPLGVGRTPAHRRARDRGPGPTPTAVSLTELVLRTANAAATLRTPTRPGNEDPHPAIPGASPTDLDGPDTEPGVGAALGETAAEATQPGSPPPAREHAGGRSDLAALLLAAPADVDTLPGAPAP